MKDSYYYIILVAIIIFVMSCLWWVWNVSNEMEDPPDESEIPTPAELRSEDMTTIAVRHNYPILYVPPGGYIIAYIPPGEEDRADALAEARWANKVITAPYPQRPLHPVPSTNTRGIGFALHNNSAIHHPAEVIRTTGSIYPLPIQQSAAQGSVNQSHIRQSENTSCPPYPPKEDTTIEIPVLDSPYLVTPKHQIQQPITDADGNRSESSVSLIPDPVPSAPVEEEEGYLPVLSIRLEKIEGNELKLSDK